MVKSVSPRLGLDRNLSKCCQRSCRFPFVVSLNLVDRDLWLQAEEILGSLRKADEDPRGFGRALFPATHHLEHRLDLAGRNGKMLDDPQGHLQRLDLLPQSHSAEAIPSGTHRSRELQLVLDPKFLEADPTSGISSERFFRRPPSGALTVRVKITASSRVRRNKRPQGGGSSGLFPSKVSTPARPEPRNPSGHPHSLSPATDDECTTKHTGIRKYTPPHHQNKREMSRKSQKKWQKAAKSAQ